MSIDGKKNVVIHQLSIQERTPHGEGHCPFEHCKIKCPYKGSLYYNTWHILGNISTYTYPPQA